jgi:hypothetical protein
MKLLLLNLSLLIVSTLYSQNNSCLEDFDYLVTKIKNDYPGYLDKVNDENISELKRLEIGTREKIILYPDSCKYYLDEYTAWFNDYHLRVSYNRNFEKQEETIQNDKQYFEFDFETISQQTETLEGIWVGFRGKIAIVKQDGQKYIGISIDYSGYDKNQIIFEAQENENNEFDLITFRNYNDFFPTKEKASIQLNCSVFEIHEDTRFVRKTENSIFDQALLRTYVPIFPNGVNTYPVATAINDSTYFLRIPSFNTNTANDFVIKHWEEIMSRPNLIIDIRNNGGGQDNYYSNLADIIYTQPYESKGVEWYSTKGIIEDWEYSLANGQIKEGFEEEAEALLEEMKKNIGGFVLHPYYGSDGMIEKDTIYNYPKKVGIIINENNGSSAEQFLLSAQNSSKVVLFGANNTAGVLDYSNITPKTLPSGKYELWLPATRSRRLPDNPIDNIGIAPDIIIPLEPQKQLYDKLDSWVYFVKNYLELMNK